MNLIKCIWDMKESLKDDERASEVLNEVYSILKDGASSFGWVSDTGKVHRAQMVIVNDRFAADIHVMKDADDLLGTHWTLLCITQRWSA